MRGATYLLTMASTIVDNFLKIKNQNMFLGQSKLRVFGPPLHQDLA